MVIGRMHLHSGLVIERTHDPERPIRIGLTHGGDPFNKNTPVVWFNFTEQQFASAVAHAARRGQTGETYREVLAFLQCDSFEDETPSARSGGPMTPTCATCRYFQSTANKAKYPDANAGRCRNSVLSNRGTFRVWESFGCTLHAPTAAQGAASREEPGLCTCEAAWTCPTCRAEDDYVPPTPPQETP